jgi:hypothetical protein
MRSCYLLALLVLITTNAFTQNFEGKIIYQLQYRSKWPSLKVEDLQSTLGTEHEYLVKNGNYKTTISPNAMVQWQLYSHQDNKLYNQFTNNPTILWYDGAKNTDTVYSYTINKNVVKVAGYDCDELIMRCKRGIMKYYYNAAIKADPLVYKQHRFGNWYFYLQLTQALPLKYIYELTQYSIEHTATQVLPMQLEDSLFQLPANAKTVTADSKD